MFSLYCSKSEFLMTTVEKKLPSSSSLEDKFKIYHSFFARFFSERFVHQKKKKKSVKSVSSSALLHSPTWNNKLRDLQGYITEKNV